MKSVDFVFGFSAARLSAHRCPCSVSIFLCSHCVSIPACSVVHSLFLSLSLLLTLSLSVCLSVSLSIFISLLSALFSVSALSRCHCLSSLCLSLSSLSALFFCLWCLSLFSLSLSLVLSFSLLQKHRISPVAKCHHKKQAKSRTITGARLGSYTHEFGNKNNIWWKDGVTVEDTVHQKHDLQFSFSFWAKIHVSEEKSPRNCRSSPGSRFLRQICFGGWGSPDQTQRG